MIELALSKIKIDENRNEQVIIFREKEGERYLPVVIGMAEVNAIKLKLSGVKPPRPLTHDLFVQIFEKLGTKLEKVVIDRLENNTFYAKLHLNRNGDGPVIIDARPSDSVAIAIRTGAPIFVNDDVIGQAGVTEI
ncbi:MAG TPA: bifunctional nuclease family protein [Verrucomicrobiae bacterium]|jgi:bifunctional DNase/RNase|nr:bifunctional nuclease family protein [Verrucomicrobiae bacterium]